MTSSAKLFAISTVIIGVFSAIIQYFGSFVMFLETKTSDFFVWYSSLQDIPRCWLTFAMHLVFCWAVTGLAMRLTKPQLSDADIGFVCFSPIALPFLVAFYSGTGLLSILTIGTFPFPFTQRFKKMMQ